MRTRALLVFVLGLGACSWAQDESCSDYCTATYPQHTYPNLEDHSACARGCRLAVMDALISWPFKPEHSFCLKTCQDAYNTASTKAYACQVGCNVTTIDQKVPNRNHIYQEVVNISSSTEAGFVMEVFEAVSNQLARVPPFGSQMQELAQHAEAMAQLLPEGGGGSVSTIVIVEGDDEVVEVQYGQAVVDSAHASSLDDLLEERERERESNVGYDPEMVTYRLSCPWSYTGARRLLAVLGLGLILVAIVSCCCSGILSDEAPSNEEGGTTKSEKLRVFVREKELVFSPPLKAPVTFYPGYPQPLPYYGGKKSTQL